MKELTDGIINDRESVSGDAKRVMHRYKDDRPDVEKKLLDNIRDRGYGPPSETKPHPGKTPDPNDDCSPGDSKIYRDGKGLDYHNDASWEEDPLSYSYNKELSQTVKDWLSYGNEFMNKLEANGDLFYTDLRRWGRELFNTAGL